MSGIERQAVERGRLVRGAGQPAGTRSGDVAGRVLQPGRNCWRVAHARHAAVLIDASCYFEVLERALERARRSILIIGWDFDGRIRLRRDAGDGASQPLGPLLRSLVESRPGLEVRILVWSVAVVHAPGAPLPLLLGADWQDHPRITLRLDKTHPLYGAHHQKVVCIDDTLAFAGGIDLTVRRWDTPRHAAADPMRVNPDGTPYGPTHDIQMVVDADAARALAALARQRWRNATGEEPAPAAADDDAWPSELVADFTRTQIAIARTVPAWGDEPAVGEAAQLTADAFAAARRCLYIEAQYLTAGRFGDILADSLARPDGPEVIILMTHASRGLMERWVMGRNRDRLIRRLKRADRFDRLRVWYPVVPAADGECQVLIHSKLIIVDETLVRVGSSNLNNRSIGLDTECDLAVEAADDKARRTIAHLRDRLLAEHLGVDPDLVARTAAAEGSLIRAIERLNHNPRGLRPFEALTEGGPTRPVFGTRLLDPKKPFRWSRLLGRRRRTG